MWKLEKMLLPPHNDRMYKGEHPHMLGTDRCSCLHDFWLSAHLRDSPFIPVPSNWGHHFLPPLPAWVSSCVKVFLPIVKGSFNMLSDVLHGERRGPGSYSSQ